jgi:YHS domain-containing protein
MARAKCRICGKTLDTNTAYKVTDKNGKNKYFCSVSEFETEETRKKKSQEDKDRVYRLICDIMCVKEIISTALWKEWQVWLKVADNEKIAQYLEENKDYLTSAMSRIGSSEYGCIRYLSTIIKNSLADFKPKVEVVEKPKVVVEEHYETKYKSKTRQALDDFEEEWDE